MKRTLAIIIAVVMVVGLMAACGNSGSSSTAAPSTAASSAPASSAPASSTASAPTPAAERTEVWKISTMGADEDAVTLGLKKFEEEIEAKLPTVDVQVFDNGTLGTSTDATLGGILNGIVQGSEVASGNAAEYTSAFVPLDSPYLFIDRDQVLKFVQSDAVQMMREKCEADSGLYFVGFLDFGYRNLSNSKREVSTIADISGLKVRTMSNPIHMAAWEALGANVTVMSFSELYTALQQHTVDGEENPLSVMYMYSFYEPNPYITLTEHVYTLDAYFMGADWFNGLSDEYKNAVTDSWKAVMEYQFPISNENNETALQKLKDAGATVSEFSVEEKQKAQELVADSWKLAAETCGEEYYNQIVDIAKGN